MNQILTINKSSIYSNYYKSKKRYFFIFYLSISICTLLLFFFLFTLSNRLNELKNTSLLKNKYKIITLYSSADNPTVLKLSNNLSIIGSIDIPKINISYPILENTNKNMLKVSVCRFSGPSPNKIGNLCIAGHNYKNKLMFSNLYKLNIGDSIFITDLNNIKLKYIIYNKSTVNENNLDCIKNTNNIEITLITCNRNNNSERIVIKAKMKGL